MVSSSLREVEGNLPKGGPVAPLPVLGDEAAELKTPAIVIWSNIAAWFGALVYSCGMVFLLINMESPLLALFCSVAAAFSFALIDVLPKRKRFAWMMQVVAAVLGLAVFPFGTVFYIFLFTRWFQPETREWFGIGLESEATPLRR